MWPHVRTFDSSPISSEILLVSFDSALLIVFSFSVSLFVILRQTNKLLHFTSLFFLSLSFFFL